MRPVSFVIAVVSVVDDSGDTTAMVAATGFFIGLLLPLCYSRTRRLIPYIFCSFVIAGTDEWIVWLRFMHASHRPSTYLFIQIPDKRVIAESRKLQTRYAKYGKTVPMDFGTEICRNDSRI